MIEYKYELDNNSGICLVFVTGTFKRPENTREMQVLMSDLHDKYGYHRFFFDLTRASVESETLSTFEAGSKSPSGMDELIRRFSIAIVYAELTDDEKFFEDVASNRGYRLRVFEEIDDAKQWLEPENENT